ncbi:MAG: FAD-dependent oxidoreductase [Bacteroidales bacterium]|nr:FAD-dependent oxidoreductase [Bacteroidales bacterium]
MKRACSILLFSLLACSLAFAKSRDAVLLEAEAFGEHGGWVVDQQFMDQMGSPYLLAHGLGKPVANAKTSVKLPKKGQWYVFARTWNWCAPWGVREGPGVFRIAVDGQPLENVLGTGKQWGWEYAGSFKADRKEATLELCDLTGFEGRCDAVVLSRNPDPALPADIKQLQAFRKKMLGLPDKPRSAGNFDLVVVGAGTAGLSVAIKGAREGLKVALINDRPVPGGNNSTELRILASGKMNVAPYDSLGNVIRDIQNVYDKEAKVINMLESDQNISYFPSMHVFSVRMDGNRIVSAVAKHIETSEELEFCSPLFADCSGDGNLGYLAGAEYRVGREMRADTRETLAPDRPDNMVLGASTPWGTTLRQEDVPFPVCDWAIQFNEESCEKVTSGSNWWESGFWHDQVAEAEYIRDYLFRAIYGNWSFLKNQSADKADYSKLELTRLSFIAGKRESRRLIGDVFFTQQDIERDYVKYDDAIVYGSYSIDQHFPTPKNTFFFPREEFISTMKHYFNDLGTPRRYLRKDQVPPPYMIPYRCLYSVNVDNMFMAGRNVSVSHIALSSTRVQNVTGMMGEVVAVAAALCKKYNCSPREVYTLHLQELLDAFKG